MRPAAVWAGLAAVAGVIGVTAWLLAGGEATTGSEARSADGSSRSALGPSSDPTSLEPDGSDAVTGGSESLQSNAALEVGQSVPAPDDSADGEHDPTPAPSAHVSGFVLDDLENALAGHIIEIYLGQGPTEGDRDRKPDGRAVTETDGSFRVDGLQAGPNELRLIAPGAGDVFEACLDHFSGCSTRLVSEERRLPLTLPEAGLDRMKIVVRGHGDRLISFRIVDDLDQPLAHCLFTIDGRGDEVHFISDEAGLICEPMAVQQQVALRLRFYAKIPHGFESTDDLHARLMRDRYGPIELHLEAAPRQQDLGTLVMPRMAGLALNLADGTNGQGIGGATVRLKYTGGGVLPAEARGEMDSDGTYILWSGRSAGEYELDVTATGYQPTHQVGVLVAGEEPQRLELILERTR